MKYYMFILLYVFLYLKVDANEYKEGVIITTSDDTISCMIKVYEEDILLNANEIKYKNNGVKEKIQAKDIKEIQLGNKTYHIVNYDVEYYDEIFEETNIMKVTKICHLKIKGKVTLYSYYFTSQGVLAPNGYGGSYPAEYVLKEKNILATDKENQPISMLYFKKTMLSIYKDCPEMIKKIKTKEYKFSNLEQAVIYGNNVCN